jgi:DNA-binding response OmpR family regulator
MRYVDCSPIGDAPELNRSVSILGVALSAEDWACIARSPILGGTLDLRAGTCREALDRIADRTADIVISASELPDGTWRDILAASQQLPIPPPVLIASRLADELLWAEVLNLGAFDLIARPFDTRELGWVVMSALGMPPSSLVGNVQVNRVKEEVDSCSVALMNR